MAMNEATMGRRMRLRSTALPGQILAAFSGLGYAFALFALLSMGTAVRWVCGGFKSESFGQIVAVVFGATLQFGEALLLPILVIIVAFNLAPSAGLRRVFVTGISTLAAVVVCVALVIARPIDDESDRVYAHLAVCVVLFAAAFELRHRSLAAAGALLRTEIDAVAANAQLQRSRLKVLRAQIAPHFLFNTLANVRRLSRVDRNGAASMLGDLAHYFSITLAHDDEARSTLAAEAELVDAYLRIHRIRMGARLTYQLDLPTELRGARLPPMTLLTLVENAIKHGIDPLIDGGCVEISVQRRDAILHIEVADNGRGITSSEGQGMGLANIRARLAMLYGRRASLSLAHRHPQGFVARLHLPLEYGL